MGMMGHNNGPSMDGGASWRKHCWTAAREALLPTLPIEVVRNRVRRARELGLDYKTYASVRAQTGHDVVAFLFSSNALRVGPLTPVMPQAQTDKLAAVTGAQRVGLAVAPLSVTALAQNAVLDRTHPAPHVLLPFAALSQAIRDILGKTPGDRVVLVGDAPLERDWCAAGRLAAYLPADRYFSAIG